MQPGEAELVLVLAEDSLDLKRLNVERKVLAAKALEEFAEHADPSFHRDCVFRFLLFVEHDHIRALFFR